MSESDLAGRPHGLKLDLSALWSLEIDWLVAIFWTGPSVPLLADDKKTSLFAWNGIIFAPLESLHCRYK